MSSLLYGGFPAAYGLRLPLPGQATGIVPEEEGGSPCCVVSPAPPVLAMAAACLLHYARMTPCADGTAASALLGQLPMCWWAAASALLGQLPLCCWAAASALLGQRPVCCWAAACVLLAALMLSGKRCACT